MILLKFFVQSYGVHVMTFDVHYLWSLRHTRGFVQALLSLLILLILIEWAFVFIAPTTATTPITADAIPKPIKQIDSLDDILQASLFGEYVPHSLNEAHVKKSMLQVSISGIMFSDKKQGSEVIIRLSNGEEKTYKVGDTLPGGVVIKRITADGVLVERHGILESLSLPKNDLTFEPVPKPLKEE
jgi:general secretion pathway protein C